MSLKHTEVDDKELELETWPAFVDILSSTVVVLAFAFFILVVVLSILKVTSADTDSQNEKDGGSAVTIESVLLSEKSSEFQRLSIIAPPTLAKNQASKSSTSSSTEEKRVIFVPEKAKVTNEEVRATEIGESKKEVLGEIPKFTDSRVMEVLKELLIVQQDVIAQQRKVIEQQDSKIKQTAREYQSLLSVITKANEVEDLRQQINSKPDRAKFNPLDVNGDRISGTEEKSKGNGVYVLSPPELAIKDISIKTLNNGSIKVSFNDNANYLNNNNMEAIKKDLTENIQTYKSKGVTLIAKPSNFSISSAEGRRVAVDRLILIHSILVNMGVDKSLIKFRSIDSKDSNMNAEEEENYGWVEIIPNK